MENFSSIISSQKLLGLSQNPQLRIFDVRTGNNALASYRQKHLKNAAFVDLNVDLAEIDDPKNGGRHPLPSVKEFIKTLGKLGVDENSVVVIYDDKNGANAAARFWWMLRAIGHKKVAVLDGGLQAADIDNYPMEEGDFHYSSVKYQCEEESWILPQFFMNDVENASQNPDFVIVDVRETQRYQGLHEPIDLVAGHIPNAINLPFVDNLDAEGKFLSSEQLKEKYKSLFRKYDKDKIIFHCGSGVTACHSLLALDYAGFEIPNLYVGSWSEWSRNHKI